jgi:hypothetical protein
MALAASTEIPASTRSRHAPLAAATAFVPMGSNARDAMALAAQ